MRISEAFIPTLREVPAEAEVASHQLMLRAGMIRKLASGIYSYLPLGNRTFRKVEHIVREEMERAGAQELIMPALLPSDYYRESGRWDYYGPDMFRLKDRSSRDFCLGPTHEEIFTEVVRNEIRSYRALPLMLYQIQTKFRDERRPRFGVLRSREFVMKDAYSFDRDKQGLDISYKKMYDAYCRIFERCGLEYLSVEADSGAMGGSDSQEFMVLSEIGEDIIAYCKACGYSANEEKAPCMALRQGETDQGSLKSSEMMMRRVATPDVRTIEDLTAFFGCGPDKFGKTLLYKADERIVAVLLRGDRELNEVKLKNHLGCNELIMAGQDDVMGATGAEVGFAGPIGLKKGIEIIADLEIPRMVDFITGANETGYHLADVNYGRDFKASSTADIRNAVSGDPCPRCGAALDFATGIEVGHVFKLGTKYSKVMNCVYLDENGAENPMVMGSYGIGLARVMAAVIEQNYDENGIIWPVSIAPYHVVIVPVNMGDPIIAETGERLYRQLLDSGKNIEVMLDDRDERPGVKFKDADLIGIPIRIVIGRKASSGIVELKFRDSSEVLEFNISEILPVIMEKIGSK